MLISSDGTRTRSGLQWYGLCLLLIVTGAVTAAGRPSSIPVYSYDLTPEIQARVLDDGTMLFWLEQDGMREELLRTEMPLPLPRRPGQNEESLFTALFSEGAAGGHRGFARDANDDRDDLTDEDPADGLDNDEDGLIDEDFAAISDAMTVVHRIHGGRSLHLETYHWEYPHLNSTVLLACRLEAQFGGGHSDSLTFTAPDTEWREYHFTWRVHGVTCDEEPQTAVLVAAAVPDPAGGPGFFWVGVSPLSSRADSTPLPSPPLMDKSQLKIHLAQGHAELAVSVAPTLLQLRCNLAAAQGVYLGAGNPSAEQRVNWLVPPLCPVCRTGKVPPAHVEPLAESWLLVFEVEPGQNALLDPDRFFLDGVAAGRPQAVHWRERSDCLDLTTDSVGSAREWTIPWYVMGSPARENGSEREPDLEPLLVNPALWQHAGCGDLCFEFHSTNLIQDKIVSPLVTGETLCGHQFQQELQEFQSVEFDRADNFATTKNRPTTSRSTLSGGNRPPTLAPSLLENYPNPFQEQTRFRYRVPATVEEGFVWETGAAPDIEPTSAIPYRSTQPTVSLRVYAVDGQEIATLYVGSLPVGEYEAVWDGTDASGRIVASGTYFCKLQIENWAVTKRLSFLR